MRLTNHTRTFLNFDFNPNLDTNFPRKYGNNHTNINTYSISCSNINNSSHFNYLPHRDSQRDRHHRTRIPHSHQSTHITYTNNLHP
jgi:hypothetical protein